MNNSELKEQLKSVFDAPTATKKQFFLQNYDFHKATQFDFFKAQSGYIRKRVWIVNVLFFLSVFAGIQLNKAHLDILYVISSTLPFLSLVSITEIAKSTSHNMLELETSCKYSFSQVILTRLSLLGSFNFAVLLGILLLLTGKTDYDFLRLNVYLLTPFLFTSYCSLLVINHFRVKETNYICGGISGLVCALSIWCTTQMNVLFMDKYLVFCSIAFGVLIIALFTEILKLIKRTEDLQWNLPLTA